MLEYYDKLFRRPDALAHSAFKDAMGFDLTDLVGKRPSAKVRQEPKLLRRAILFLGIVGEVLCPGSEQPGSVLSERVFLRPQWLVDVMKEFVRHDLRIKVDTIDSSQTADVIQVKALGQLFCDKGVLDRRLLPWLWRDLPFPLAQKSDEIDFLLGLLTELGRADVDACHAGAPPPCHHKSSCAQLLGRKPCACADSEHVLSSDLYE